MHYKKHSSFFDQILHSNFNYIIFNFSKIYHEVQSSKDKAFIRFLMCLIITYELKWKQKEWYHMDFGWILYVCVYTLYTIILESNDKI